MCAEGLRVAYVVKRYPRFSETFIVNEILALEAQGVEIGVFSLFPATDSHFHDMLSRVRAPVRCLSAESLRAGDLWGAFAGAADTLPGFWANLERARGEDSRHVYQGVQLALQVRAGGYGHIHAHFAGAQTSVARLASRFSGVPFSFTAHAKDIYHEGVDGADLRGKLRDAHFAVTVSDYNLSHLRARFPAETTRLRRIYNGLDLQHFVPASGERQAERIVAVGRLVEKKGFGDLLEACALLRAAGREFECLIVGAGPLEATLRDQRRALGLDAQVQLLGPRPQAEVMALLRGAALFAAPCLVAPDGDRDGLPTVLLEAMALGTPCLTTDVTGIPEIVRHRDTGWTVPPRDPAALALGLAHLLDHPRERRRLAVAGRRVIEAGFDSARSAAQLRGLLAGAHQQRPAEVA